MKTLYDWSPRGRGWELKPKGVDSIRARVFLGKNGADLRKLYRAGRLTGRALEDARMQYEGKVEQGVLFR